MRIDSSDSDFEGPPVSKKPLVEISDEELSTTSEVVVCGCGCVGGWVWVCTDLRTGDSTNECICIMQSGVEEAMVQSAVQRSLLECGSTSVQEECDPKYVLIL